MDSSDAISRGMAARAAGHTRQRVFDWDKAARIILDRSPTSAMAGLGQDLGWTGGDIWRDGAIVTDEYTYLASIWAHPVIVLDDGRESIDCWRWEDEVPGWDAATKWPDSARAIIALEASQ